MLLFLALSALQSAPSPQLYHFAKPRLVTYGFLAAPRICVLDDLDGDGFGDLTAVMDEPAGAVEIARSIRGGKLASPVGVGSPDNAKLKTLDAWVERDAEKHAVLCVRRSDQSVVEIRVPRDGAPAATVRSAAAAASSPAASRPAAVRSLAVAARADDAGVLRADFDGDGKLDECVQGVVRLAADPARPLPCPFGTPPADAYFFAGDWNGDGRADLGMARRDPAWRVGGDVSIALVYKDGDPDPDGDGLNAEEEAAAHTDPLEADTDHDGLPDGWEVKGEGALDLPALGASPVHKDCFVYVQRVEDTNGALCTREVARVVKTWSELPVKNPDGSAGIALHPVWLPTIPLKNAQKAWWDQAAGNVPEPSRGIAHYMVISRGGGGQAAELGDAGGCGQDALWACFLHEFGHQVGLSHSGGALPGLCPTYTSLMNYAYSYGFEDDGNKIHYSRGEFVSMPLNEERLDERLPVPFEKLSFLAKGPYRFRVEKDGDGTKIDWNRNGKFDTSPVRADITDVYGANPGYRNPVGKTIFSPALAAHGKRLVLAGVTREKKLFVRSCAEEGKWSDELAVAAVEPAGDPCLLSAADGIHLFVPTAAGVRHASAPDADSLARAEFGVLADSAGCGVSAALLHGAAAALLWRGPQQPVRITRLANGAWSAPRDLAGMMSEMTPGALEDPKTGEWLVASAATKHDGANVRHQWKLTRLAARDDGGFDVRTETIVGGEKSGWSGNSRPVLLMETGPRAIEEGRLHLIARGWCDPADANGCYWEAVRIGDASQDEGWRLRRFNDEWTTTKSPVGACWFQDDIVVAYRWFGNVHGDDDDNLHVAHHALGIDHEDLCDFDDVKEIADMGLERSIPWRAQSVAK